MGICACVLLVPVMLIQQQQIYIVTILYFSNCKRNKLKNKKKWNWKLGKIEILMTTLIWSNVYSLSSSSTHCTLTWCNITIILCTIYFSSLFSAKHKKIIIAWICCFFCLFATSHDSLHHKMLVYHLPELANRKLSAFYSY